MIARRHNLLSNLLVMSVIVAGCSITATAWLAAQSTSGAINQKIGESLATDAKIYDSLLGYAATHPDWSGVRQKVEDLSAQTGRRITLTTQNRNRIADSQDANPEDANSQDAGNTPLPQTPSAVVDPLNVDARIKPDSARIDARAVGPYRLTKEQQTALNTIAQRLRSCVTRSGSQDAVITKAPNGRPSITFTDRNGAQSRLPAIAAPCATEIPLTESEHAAEQQLTTLAKSCLDRQGISSPAPDPGFLDRMRESSTSSEGKQCLDSARREQLTHYVAPAAQLFISQPGNAQPGPDLSTVGTSRIFWTALVVLVLTVSITALAASRLVRPIDAVTSAARRMGNGDRSARVTTKARGEIGELATTFNAMSDHIERTEEQRKTMVSDIAHELRTPLVNVRGWLEAVQDGLATLDDPLVASLLEETLLLQYLVDDLQDLALADAGELRVYPEPLDVGALLEQIVVAHRGRAETEGVELTASVAGELDLTADPARLRQTLGNLTTNALRHTPTGGRITLTARAEGEYIAIDIADTGTGIAPEQLPHIFDRFWRADKSRSRRAGGSGLGLAISHHLVEIHGGYIKVSSELGQGTTFTLHLPV